MTELFVSEIEESRKALGEIPCEDLPWTESIRASDFNGALATIEEHLHADDTSIETKLWWIRCQLELASVPATALTSPLNEIHEKLLERSDLHALACDTFLHASEQLIAKDRFRVAVSTLEKARAIAKKSEGAIGVDYTRLTQTLVSLLREEIERAETRREKGPYIKKLEKKIDSLSKEAPPREITRKNPATKKKKPSITSAKHIIEQANSSSTASEAIPTPISSHEPIEEKPRPHKTLIGRKLSAALALLILLGVGAYALSQSNLLSPVAEASAGDLTMHLVTAHANLSLLPPLQVKSRISDTSNTPERGGLRTLSQRLRNMHTNRETPSESIEAPSEDQLRKSGEVDTTALTWGEEVSPKTEPQAQASTQDSGSIRAFPEEKKLKKTPYLDPRRLKQMDVQVLGSSRRKTSISNLQKGTDGQLYAPPGGLPSAPGRQSYGNVPLRSYPVQKFNPPIVFRTIIKTDVVSSPSFVAQVMTHIPPDRDVQVIAQMGPWLELQPYRGRRAFILNQNATQRQP